MKGTEKAEYVKTLVADAIQLGITMANKCYEPQEDMLRSKNITKWTKNLGITPDVIRALVAKKKLTEHRISESPNAARYYSLVEVQQALFVEKIRTGYGGKFYDMSFLES